MKFFLQNRTSGVGQSKWLVGLRIGGVCMALSLLALGIWGWHAQTARAAEADCARPLPTVQYLGEELSQYTLPAGFETFIVKRARPLRFIQEAGELNEQGERVYNAQAGDERAWACRGSCGLTAAFGEEVPFGQLEAGTRIELVVIDDDGFEQDQDERRNWFAADDPLQPYQIIEKQTMVETLTFDVPFDAEWYFYAKDSIGIVDSCIVPPTAVPSATPTATETPLPTETPTVLPTATFTPTPTSTATSPPPTSTPPVNTPTAAMPTATASATPPSLPPSATPTATSTSAPSNTPVASPAATATPMPAATATATPTVVTLPVTEPPVPTALTLAEFRATAQPDGITLTWVTALEFETEGFHLWRSEGDSREAATRLTTNLMLAQGSPTTESAYRFQDGSAQPGKSYTYWLQEITNSEIQDVASVRVEMPAAWLYLPLVEQ